MKAVKTLIREKNILENNDLLLVSHLDELLSRESVYLAKHCHLKKSFVYGALIMPMGNMNFAFRSPVPVPGRPHSYSNHVIIAEVRRYCSSKIIIKKPSNFPVGVATER